MVDAKSDLDEPTGDSNVVDSVASASVASASSTSASAEAWQLREDLRFTWVPGRSQDEGYWVVRDPFAKDCFSISDLEKRLLGLADGCRHVLQACQDGVKMVQPSATNVSAMLQFFVQAKRQGLLKNVGVNGPLSQLAGRFASHSAPTGLSGRWMRLLFYRLPGFKPATWGNRSAPSKTSFRWMAILAASLLIVATTVLISEFDRIVSQASNAIVRGNATWWFGVVIVIAFLKTLHELAHVVACRWCGAECREIGVMLLFGTPCLYCDVSDLWMVPQTWKRVAVSSAGMIVEVLIASISLIIWSCTYDSTLHELALVLVVVGSVSTVLVNANPLLRYDGYFMLADWLGVPNLATQSQQRTRSFFRKWVWGSDEPDSISSSVGRRLHPRWLVIYGMASGAYRFFIVSFIALALYRGCAGIEFGWIGLMISIVLIAGVLARMFSSLSSPPTQSITADGPSPDQQDSVSWWRHSRARLVIGLAGFTICCLLWIPFPSKTRLPVLIFATNAEILYAKRSGQLTKTLASGQKVAAGDVIAMLKDDRLADRYSESEGKVQEARALLLGWERQKGSRVESMPRAALAKQRLEVTTDHLNQLGTEMQQLAIHAGKNGRFVSDVAASAWLPGAWISKGKRVGWVCPSLDRSGQAFAAQSQVQSIRVGQTVWAAHASLPDRTFRGTVEHVGQSPASELPEEILSITTNRLSSRKLYPISIRWETSEASNAVVQRENNQSSATLPLPVRAVATAVVEVEPASGWQRLRELLAKEILGQ